MWPFDTRKHKSLSHAVLAGDLRAARRMLEKGARLRTGREEFSMDPRFRLQIEPKIAELVVMARIHFRDSKPEMLAERVEEKLNLEFPENMSSQDRQRIRKEVRALVKKKCGVKNYLDGIAKPVPTLEEAKAMTGMSEEALTRRFMEHLIERGKNPFEGMPKHLLRDAEQKYPDLVQLARRKFGIDR